MIDQASILHLSNSEVYGGNEEHIRCLAHFIDRSRFRVYAAAPPGAPLAARLRDEVEGLLPLRIRSKIDLRAAWVLSGFIRRQGIRILHSHNRREDLIGALAAWMAGVPAVSTIHDRINVDQEGRRLDRLSNRIYRTVIRRRFERIITVSSATRAHLIGETGVEPGRVVHVTNGLDLEQVPNIPGREAGRRSHALDLSAPLVGLVARVRGTNIAKKGHRTLFAAAPRILAAHPTARFVFAGEGPIAQDYLRGLAESQGVADRCDFLGNLPDARSLIAALDVLVQPSLFEGLPRTSMEAMALGVPIVASAVDGLVELVVPGETGYLVPARDTTALAEAVSRILALPDRGRAFGEAGRKRIEQLFDARASVKALEQVYDAILNPACDL